MTEVIDSISVGQLLDDNDNEQIDFVTASSAVNHIQITNAATGNSPTINAVGDDTNIDLVLMGKGTGIVSSPGDVTTSGVYRIGGTDVVDVSQTLTNKTITDSSNNIYANALNSATTSVVVNGATAPSLGQVLTATSSTAANWQTPSGGSITYDDASSTTTYTTTSTSYTTVTGMTLTLASGTWYVSFNGSGLSSSFNTTYDYALHVGGSIVADTERRYTRVYGGTNCFVSQGVIVQGAGFTVDLRVRRIAGSGSISVYDRRITAIKLA